MTTATKWILGGCAIAVLVMFVAVAVGIFWVSSNKDRWVEQAQSLVEEGQTAGQSVTESECVTMMLERYRTEDSLLDVVRHGVRLQGCLDTSRYEPTLCQGVPKENEILATASWRVARCRDAGFEGDSSCPNLLGGLQKYCESERRREKEGSAGR